MKPMRMETLKKLQDVMMTLQIIKQTSYNFSTYRRKVDENNLSEEEAQVVIKAYDSMVMTVAREVNNYMNPIV